MGAVEMPRHVPKPAGYSAHVEQVSGDSKACVLLRNVLRRMGARLTGRFAREVDVASCYAAQVADGYEQTHADGAFR